MSLQKRARRVIARRKDIGRWTRIFLAGLRRHGGTEPRISYGHHRLPGRNEIARGGMVKFQRLAEHFPHDAKNFNVLYLGSSSLPRDWPEQLWLARRRGAVVLYNQDGVAYPGWHGPGWEVANRPQARLNEEADFVFYQSEFCRLSADKFLGTRTGPAAILNNAVDTSFFRPLDAP